MTSQRLFECLVHPGVDHVLDQFRPPNVVIRLREQPSAVTNELLGSRTLVQVQFRGKFSTTTWMCSSLHPSLRSGSSTDPSVGDAAASEKTSSPPDGLKAASSLYAAVTCSDSPIKIFSRHAGRNSSRSGLSPEWLNAALHLASKSLRPITQFPRIAAPRPSCLTPGGAS